MADKVPVLARDWVVKCGSTEVLGLDTITFGSDSKEADATTNDSNGFQEHQIAERGNSVKIDGLYLEDESGAQDAGQAAVEALGVAVGAASVGAFTLISPGGKTRTFNGTVKMGDVAGKGSEMSKWSAEIKVSGEITIGTGS